MFYKRRLSLDVSFLFTLIFFFLQARLLFFIQCSVYFKVVRLCLRVLFLSRPSCFCSIFLHVFTDVFLLPRHLTFTNALVLLVRHTCRFVGCQNLLFGDVDVLFAIRNTFNHIRTRLQSQHAHTHAATLTQYYMISLYP